MGLSRRYSRLCRYDVKFAADFWLNYVLTVCIAPKHFHRQLDKEFLENGGGGGHDVVALAYFNEVSKLAPLDRTKY